MGRCQFIYIRASKGHVCGGQCENEATTKDGNLCQLHHMKQRAQHNSIWHREQQSIETSQWSGICSEDANPSNNEFPRLYCNEEIRAWVEEARERTDLKCNWRRGCIVCGWSTIDSGMIPITGLDLKHLKALLN